MLYYNSINIEQYYKLNKIITTLKINKKGIFFDNKLISYNQMFLSVDKNQNHLIYFYHYDSGRNIIIGEIDKN